jgi:hypothetical protein
VSRLVQLLELIPRAPQVLRTLRHIRPAQAWAQVHHMLNGLPAPLQAKGPAPRLALSEAHTAFLPPPDHVRGNARRIELLGVEIGLGGDIEWEPDLHGPLLAYHLHQQEWLRLSTFEPAARARPILDWIRSHPVGIGWDPHPISLRLLCWGRLLLSRNALPSDPEFRDALLKSMADQAATLVSGLEERLQANHLLSNLLSIVWAGVLVEGAEADRWRGFSGRLLDELDAQVHPDGGHEERSPMYHSLLLENILDLLNLCLATPERAPAGLAEALEATATRMLGALRVLTHADGQIALFADSGIGISATFASLADYALRLGVQAGTEDAFAAESAPTARSALLPQTGYLRLASGDFDLLASVAGPAPAHQPGHAHCDALSFELSVKGQRLISDTGLFEYRAGERRDRARATSSHSTIQIDGQEQAEVWAAHRVGGRPQVELSAGPVAGAGEAGEASCRGWSKGAPTHSRLFRVATSGVEIVDRIDGPYTELVSRLFFAPEWTVDAMDDKQNALGGPIARAHRRTADGRRKVVEVELPASFTWVVESAPTYPSFGREESRAVLVGRSSESAESVIRFSLLES